MIFEAKFVRTNVARTNVARTNVAWTNVTVTVGIFSRWSQEPAFKVWSKLGQKQLNYCRHIVPGGGWVCKPSLVFSLGPKLNNKI